MRDSRTARFRQRHLKLAALAAVAALAIQAGPSYASGNTVSCISRSFTCSAGTCTETAPSTNTGTALGYVQSYYVRICADSGQTLSGAGTMRDYHCSATLSPPCSQVHDNNLSVTASSVRCQEWAPFVVPYIDTTTDTFWWSPSGVTVSSGNLTIYICPQK